MDAATRKSLQDGLRSAMPERRNDLLKLMADAREAGDLKAVRSYEKMLRQIDKAISDYGLDRHA